MVNENHIRQGLHAQGISVSETDTLLIRGVLSVINQTEADLKEFPELNKEGPILNFDKGVTL